MNYQYKLVFAFVAVLILADTVCAQEQSKVPVFYTPARDSVEINGEKQLLNWFGFCVPELKLEGPPYSARSGFSELHSSGLDGGWRRIERRHQM